MNTRVFLAQIFKLIFIVFSLLDAYIIFIGNKEAELIITSSLPIFLGISYLFSVQKIDFIFLGVLLLFSIADFFLVLGQGYIGYVILIYTLAVFMLSFIFYWHNKEVVVSNLILIALPFIICFTASVLLIDNFGDNLALVIVYLLGLISSGVLAFSNYTNNKIKGNLEIFIGTFIFVCSNSIVGVNLFLGSTIFYEIIILLTYAIAIYFITNGMILNQRGTYLQNRV